MNWLDESGQGLVEYALILSLIALVILSVFTIFGGDFKNILTREVEEDKVSARKSSLSKAMYD